MSTALSWRRPPPEPVVLAPFHANSELRIRTARAALLRDHGDARVHLTSSNSFSEGAVEASLLREAAVAEAQLSEPGSVAEAAAEQAAATELAAAEEAAADAALAKERAVEVAVAAAVSAHAAEEASAAAYLAASRAHAATVAGWRTFRSKSQPKTDSPALSVQSRLGGGLRTAFRMRRMASWTSGEKGRARSVTVTFARAHAESAAHVAAPSVAAAPTRPSSRCATMRGARPPSGPPMAARGVENPKRRARSRLKPTTHDDIVGTEPTTPTAAAGCSSKISAMSEAPRTGAARGAAARGAARVFTAAGTATAAPARKAATTPATLSRDAAAPRSTTTARAYPAAAAARTTSDHAPKIARSPRPASSSGQTATLERPSSCSRAAAAAAAPSSTITTS